MSIIKAMAANYRQEITEHAGRSVKRPKSKTKSDFSMLMEELAPILDEGEVKAATKQLLVEDDQRRGWRRHRPEMSMDPLTYDKQCESPRSIHIDLSQGGDSTGVLMEDTQGVDPRVDLDLSQVDVVLGNLANVLDKGMNEEHLHEVAGITLAMGALGVLGGLGLAGAGITKLASKKGTPDYIRDASPATALRVYEQLHKKLKLFRKLISRKSRKERISRQVDILEAKIEDIKADLVAAKAHADRLYKNWMTVIKRRTALRGNLASQSERQLKKLIKAVDSSFSIPRGASQQGLADILDDLISMEPSDAKRRASQVAGVDELKQQVDALDVKRRELIALRTRAEGAALFTGTGNYEEKSKRAAAKIDMWASRLAQWKKDFVRHQKLSFDDGGPKAKQYLAAKSKLTALRSNVPAAMVQQVDTALRALEDMPGVTKKHQADPKQWSKSAKRAFLSFDSLRSNIKRDADDLARHLTTSAKKELASLIDTLDELYEVVEDAKRQELWSSMLTFKLGGLPNWARKQAKLYFGREIAQSRREQKALEAKLKKASKKASKKADTASNPNERHMDVEATLNDLAGGSQTQKKKTRA